MKIKRTLILLIASLAVFILTGCSNRVTQDNLMETVWMAEVEDEEDEEAGFIVEFSKSIMTMALDMDSIETESENVYEEFGAELAKGIMSNFNFKVEYELKGKTIHLVSEDLDLDHDFDVKKEKENVVFINQETDARLVLKPYKEEERAKNKKEAISETAETKTSDQKEKEQVFALGETVDFNGYEIIVNTTEFSDGSEYSKPDEGKKYLIVNVTIKNNTDKRASYYPFDFSIVADGNAESVGNSYLDGVETLNSGDLDSGASITGNLIGEVNPEAKLKLRYEANSFTDDDYIDIELN